MPFLSKKKSASSTLLVSSASSANYTTHLATSFAKFDEKKDYVRRCSVKSCKEKPKPVSFCLGKH